MVKRKGYESRKKLWNYIWLNPTCIYNGQSAAKSRIGRSPTTILVKRSRVQVFGIRSGVPLTCNDEGDDVVCAPMKIGGCLIQQLWSSVH